MSGDEGRDAVVAGVLCPLGLALMFAAMLAACGADEGVVSSIPSGAQVVHVTVTSDGVRLEPSSVGAGAVWLLIDGNESGRGADLALVRGSALDGDTVGGLTDAQLTELASQGHAFNTHTVAGLGRVSPQTFVAGRYAFVVPTLAGSDAARSALAVLEVQP